MASNTHTWSRPDPIFPSDVVTCFAEAGSPKEVSIPSADDCFALTGMMTVEIEYLAHLHSEGASTETMEVIDVRALEQGAAEMARGYGGPAEDLESLKRIIEWVKRRQALFLPARAEDWHRPAGKIGIILWRMFRDADFEFKSPAGVRLLVLLLKRMGFAFKARHKGIIKEVDAGPRVAQFIRRNLRNWPPSENPRLREIVRNGVFRIRMPPPLRRTVSLTRRALSKGVRW
jgi:hypothetical protein